MDPVQPGSSRPPPGKPTPGKPEHQKQATNKKISRVIDQFYKLVEDKEIGGRKPIWRTLGKTISNNDAEREKYDWTRQDGWGDRRSRKVRQLDFIVPIFQIDNYTVGTPPRREVCIMGLNDNINIDFLTKMASKYGDTLEVVIHFHPETRKHLGFGMIVFRCTTAASQFCTDNNGRTVMGLELSCRLDPWAALVSHEFETATMHPCPLPKHLRDIDENHLIRIRDEICAKEYPPKVVSSSPMPQSEPMELSPGSPPMGGAHTPDYPPIEERVQHPQRGPLTPQDEGEERFVERRRPMTPRSPPRSRPNSRQQMQRPPSRGPPLNVSSGVYPSTTVPPPPPFVYGIPPPPYPGVISSPPQPPTRFPASSRRPREASPPVEFVARPTVPLEGSVSPPDDERVQQRRRSERKRRSRSRSYERRRESTSRNGNRKRKHRHHSSDSSASTSSSSDSSIASERTEVEKKEYSYYREKRNEKERIVEKIKKVTKKTKMTYKQRPDRRVVDPVVPGAEAISDDSSTADSVSTGEIMRRNIRMKEGGGRSMEKRRKKDKGEQGGHRWSSTSSESEDSRRKRKEKKNKSREKEKRRRDESFSTPRVPPPSSSTTHSLPCLPSDLSTSSRNTTVSRALFPPGACTPATPGTPHSLPHTPIHIPPPPLGCRAVGTPVFTPNIPPPPLPFSHIPTDFSVPPPIIGTPQQQTKLSVRIVSDCIPPPPSITSPIHTVDGNVSGGSSFCSPTRFKESIEDRIGSIFGVTAPAKKQYQQPAQHQHGGGAQKSVSDRQLMDMELGSNSDEREDEEAEEEKVDETARLITLEFASQNATTVSVYQLKEEVESVVCKDLFKTIEKASYELLDEFATKRRHEIEEQNKRKALESLRAAEAGSSTTPHTSPIKEPLFIQSLVSPDGPQMFSMPKLPSFKRKKLPSPSPGYRSRSGSPSDGQSPSRQRKGRSDESEEESSDSDSDRAHVASSESDDESSDNEIMKRSSHTKRKSPIRSVSASVTASSSLSSSTSSSSSSSESSSDDEASSTVAGEIDEGESSEEEESQDSTTVDAPILASRTEEEEEKGLLSEVPNGLLPESLEETGDALDEVTRNVKAIFSAAKKNAEQVPPKPAPVPKKVVEKKAKGKRISNELAGLLPPPVVPRKGGATRALEKVFEKRTKDEEEKITKEYEVLDCEDQEYLRRVLSRLQPHQPSMLNGVDTKWDQLHGVNCVQPPPFGRYVPFVPLIPTPTPTLLDRPSKLGRIDLFYSDKELAGVRPHKTGCARTEGFYRVTHKEKRRLMRRPEGLELRTDISERDETVVRHAVQMSREQKAMNRRLLTSMADTNSDLFKVNQLKYRKKMIKFARSRIHGWGLYALEPIAPDDMIVEYVGQKVRPSVADEREKAYERRGIGSSYLFRIDEDEVIDATKMGNFARFINHSCQPNCYAKVVTVDGDKRIVIYSKCLINKGDEITYDYKFPIEEDKIDCLCSAPNCRGTLN